MATGPLSVNPAVQPVQPEEWSREMRPANLYLLERGSRAGQVLGEGARDLISGGTKAATTAVSDMTQDQLQKGTDKVNSEFGTMVADASDTKPDMFGNDTDPNKGVPAGVIMAGKRMQSLQNMYNSKPDLSSYYHAQLQSVVQQTKAAYPGFGDVIDKQIKEIAGVDPANALARDRIAQLTQNRQAQSDEMKFQRSFISKNLGTLYNLYGDNWQKQPFDKIFRDVAKYDGQKAGLQADKTQLEYDDLKSKAGITKGIGLLSDELGFASRTLQTQVIEKATGDNPQALIAEARKETSQGGPLDAKTQGRLMTAIQTYQDRLETLWTQTINTPHRVWADAQHPDGVSYSQFVPPEELEKQHTAFIKNGMGIWESITNKDWGGLHMTHTLNLAASDAAIRNLSIYNPQFDYVRGIRQELGPETDLAGMNFTNAKGQSVPVLSTLSAIHLYNSAAPDGKDTQDAGTLNGIFDQATKANKGQTPPAKWITSTAQNDATVLTNTKTSEDARINMAHHIFGLDNNGTAYLDHFDFKSRQGLMNTLASPQVTESMWQLGQKNPEVWQEYSTWVKRNFGGLYGEAENTIIAANTQRESPYEVTFDQGTGLFQDRIRPEYQGSPNIRRGTDPAPVAVHILNQGLQLLSPVLKHEDTTISKELSKLSVQNNQEGMEDLTQGKEQKRESEVPVKTIENTGKYFMDTVFPSIRGLFQSWKNFQGNPMPQTYNPDSGQKETPGLFAGGSEEGSATGD